MRQFYASALFAIATLVAVPSTLTAGEDGNKDGKASEADRTVTVEATDFDFNPKKIKIELSTTLEIVLVNKGNVTHSWAVPKLDKKSDRIQPGKQTSITLSPVESGTYKIACQVPGHETAGMVGKLIVESKD